MSSTHLLAGAAVAVLAGSASATPIFDVFGPLPQATFGGTGIPNDEVAAGMQIEDGDVTITIALSATQRFSNPALTNDGAGTYFATPGSNFGGAGESSSEGALWNFNYYIEVEGINGATPQLTDYQIDLFYDFDTTPDNGPGTLGSIDITGSLGLLDPAATVTEGSQNLLFGFLENPAPPFDTVVTPPAGSFDPNALGEYNFAITVSQPGGFSLETVAIDVVIVPSPASAALLTPAGLLLARRRR
ncbi:MAG: hypothetical protein AAFX05_00095 [Planctomycetota bacterium]